MIIKDGQIDFLDLISLMSFCIALENLDLNVSMEDIQKSSSEIEEEVNKRLEKALEEIHGHLSIQDTKLNIILRMLEELLNDNGRDISRTFGTED